VIVERHFPSVRLSAYIKSFLFIESDKARDNVVLPDTSMVMALRYKGNVSAVDEGALPLAVLSGIRDSSRFIHYDAAAANLLIVFKPGAAAAFFHEPLHELFGLSTPVEFLKHTTALKELPERLAGIQEKKAKLTLVEEALANTMIKPASDPLVTKAIQSIGSSNGNLRIANLAKELYISRDALEKRFRGTVGTSPKHFSSILRLRKAIDSHTPGKSLTDVALTAGYYDQAHFIRDFRAFTGHTPGRFFNERNFW
jgi:AraC-like DNA-binding protein